MAQNTSSLTEGSIPKILIRLSLPMIIGIAANMSFNIVDTYFIGQLGLDPLTAISFSFPVVIILLNLSIGMSIGITSVLSRGIGGDSPERVKKIATRAVFIVSLVALFFGILGIKTIEPVFYFLGAQESSMADIHSYMIWAYGAMAFRMVSIALSGVFKAHGITAVPSYAILTTAGINFVLDPIFIFGWFGMPAMGIEGAGIATFISNIAAFLVEFYLARKVYGFVGPLTTALSVEKFKEIPEIFKIALPASFGNALNPISISIGNYLLSQTDTAQVAGFGVASKIQVFCMIPVFALSSGLGPTVGQNYGQGKKDRVSEAMKWSLIFCAGYGLIQAVLLTWFGPGLSTIFTDNEAAISFSNKFLKIIGWSLFGYSFVVITSAFFNAINRAPISTVSIALRTIVFFLLFFGLFHSLGQDSPVILSYFASNFAAALTALALYRWVRATS